MRGLRHEPYSKVTVAANVTIGTVRWELCSGVVGARYGFVMGSRQVT